MCISKSIPPPATHLDKAFSRQGAQQLVSMSLASLIRRALGKSHKKGHVKSHMKFSFMNLLLEINGTSLLWPKY